MNYHFSDNTDINEMLNQVVTCINELTQTQVSHIRSLTSIGKSLSSETDLNKIFDMILEEAIQFTNADGATVYRVTDDGKFLSFEIVYTGSLNLRMGGTHGKVQWPMMPLYDTDGNPRLSHIVTSVYHSGTDLCFDDVYETTEYDISGTKKTDEAHGYRCKSMLTIPLKNHEEEVLGVIQIINAMDKNRNIIPFNDEHKTMLYSLASQAAIALSNRKLIEDLENLLMQFIRAIARAIEQKSKYSSDHIMRVAALTDLLAERISKAKEGHFADVIFSENELKELSMAGWMHDVGKIITPEFIMDKSVKLETIFDRIELVRKRFDVLKLILRLHQAQLSNQAFEALLKAGLGVEIKPDDYLSYLDQELAFIERINVGGEFLPDADLQRIEYIARIKLEFEGREYRLLEDEEKYNLMIRRGTLLPEEIKKMSAHVSVTWDMLSQLSFPKKYKNVAFYASTHHEKLNGKGYPWGLTEEKLPLQSRIIAVADIFEALTSADRPYKKAKTLSESLKIMAFCVKDGDLDANLLDFFLDSGLYLEFAQKNMHESQIDVVDIQALKRIYKPNEA